MALDAASYFDHLRAYLSDAYIVDDGSAGTITLVEKYFLEPSINRAARKATRKVSLPFEGKAFALKLDGHKEPLFHFLDNNGKQWSKRCDFIIFQCVRSAINGYLFEFKTRSLEAQSIIDQLRASAHWCACLRKIVNQYTGDDRRMRLRKFVLTENENPAAYLDPVGKYLARDPSIRHYHYDHLQSLTLDTLDNQSIRTV